MRLGWAWACGRGKAVSHSCPGGAAWGGGGGWTRLFIDTHEGGRQEGRRRGAIGASGHRSPCKLLEASTIDVLIDCFRPYCAFCPRRKKNEWPLLWIHVQSLSQCNKM